MAIITTGSTNSELQVLNSKAQTQNTDIGLTNDAAASSDTGTFSLISLIKRGLQSLTAFNNKFSPLGQNTKANSVPVTIASDQGNIGVTVSNLITQLSSVFGELMVVQKQHIISLIYAHGFNSKMIKSTTTGAASTPVSGSMINLNVGTGTGNTAKVESVRNIYYQAGVGLECHFSAIFQTGTGNTLQEIGIRNANNGFTFAYINGVLGINYKNNGSTTFIPQSSFNVDKIDGTGTSGFNIDVAKLNLFKIEAQYLGAGDILFYVKPSGQTTLILVHRIAYTNLNTTPNVAQPYYKAYMYVDNANNIASAVVMKSASFDAAIQGYKTDNALITSLKTSKAGITTETCVLNIQNKATINSVNNNIPVKINTVAVCCTLGNAPVFLKIVKNANLGGTPIYTDVNVTDSVISYDVVGTTVTNGIEVFSMVCYGAGGNLVFDLSPYNIEINPSDIFTLSATTTNAATVAVAVQLMEHW